MNKLQVRALWEKEHPDQDFAHYTDWLEGLLAKCVTEKALKNMEPTSHAISDSDFTGEYLGVRRFNHETGKIERIPKDKRTALCRNFQSNYKTGWLNCTNCGGKHKDHIATQ